MKYFFLFFIFFLGCGKQRIQKIAVLLPLSGKYSSYGKDAEVGIKFFIKKQNKIPFKIEIFDFKSDSQKLKEILDRVSTDSEFLGIVGPLTSGFSLFASGIAEKKGLPLITPTATHPEITKNKKWVFRMIYSDEQQGRVLAKFLREYMGLEKTIIIYSKSNPYSLTLAEYFREVFEEKNGKIVGVEEDVKGIEEKVQELKNTGAQVIFAPLYVEDAVRIVKSCTRVKFMPLFIGGDGWYSENLIHDLKEEIKEGIRIYLSSPFHPQRRVEGMREFIDEFEIEYGRKPNFVSSLSYDALLLVLKCFKLRRISGRKDLVRCIEDMKEFNGVTGKYIFRTHTPERKIWILKPTENEFEMVTGIFTG